jgi:hypothetical protein
MPHFWPCSEKSGAQYVVCVYYDARDTFSPFPVAYMMVYMYDENCVSRPRILQKYKS